MAWRDDIRKGTASFRGVPFKTEETEQQVGRRNVTHQFPDRDKPYAEDLGKQADQFVVTGYVIGEDYLQQRDALIAALQAKGPGELRHPRFGVRDVVVIGHVSIKESHREGGIARFTITFGESGRNVFPAATEDTTRTVEAAATRVDDIAQAQYAKALSVAGPAQVALSAINRVKSTLNSVLATVRQVTSLSALGQIVGAVRQVMGRVAELIRTPVLLAQEMRSLRDQLLDGVHRPVAAIQEFHAVFDAHPRPTSSAPAGSTRDRIYRNAVAHSDFVRAIALTTQARLVSIAIDDAAQPLPPAPLATTTTTPAGATAPVATYVAPADPVITTAPAAQALRDDLLAQIDHELEVNAPQPEQAAALLQLRAAVARDVSARAEQLRQVGSFTPAVTLPVLALAQRIYQDATRAPELMARNAIRHPAFVPAKPLETLQ